MDFKNTWISRSKFWWQRDPLLTTANVL